MFHLVPVGDRLGMIDDVLGYEGAITIWILEDYHKQTWKMKHSFVNPAWRNQIPRIVTTPMGRGRAKDFL